MLRRSPLVVGLPWVQLALLSSIWLASTWPAHAQLCAPSDSTAGVPSFDSKIEADMQADIQTDRGRPIGQEAQYRAWTLLCAALQQHAPAGLPGEDVQVEWQGALRPRSQARTAEPPWEPAFPLRWQVRISRDGERAAVDEELQWPSFTSRYRSVVTAEGGFDLDLSSGATSPPQREPAELLARVVRDLPPLLLREILEREAASLRLAGTVELAGESLVSVAAQHRGERLDLLLDDRPRLVGWGRMIEAPMLGDAYEIVRFLGDSERAGLRLPVRLVRSFDGLGVTTELELVSFAWQALDPALLEPPTRRPESSGTAEGEEAAKAVVETLGAGVHRWPVPGQPDYGSLIVERSDHLVLVEAPVGEAAVLALLEEVRERFPHRPIRWIVATHHHFDHSGGVPAALLETGATLVTTAGNVEFFRRAMRGPRTLEGRGPSNAPQIQLVRERWRVPGGPPTVDVLRVEPNEHATEMLVVLLPESKVLFQGDLVRFPLDPAETLRPQAHALRRLVLSRPAEIERIAGVHGEVGRAAELEPLAPDH